MPLSRVGLLAVVAQPFMGVSIDTDHVRPVWICETCGFVNDTGLIYSMALRLRHKGSHLHCQFNKCTSWVLLAHTLSEHSVLVGVRLRARLCVRASCQ